MSYLSITKFGIAIVVGVILSFFFVAMTVPQTVERPVIEITPVPTPEPIYVKPTVMSENLDETTVDARGDISSLKIFVTILLIDVFVFTIGSMFISLYLNNGKLYPDK